MLFIGIFLILAIGGRWACSTICPLGIIEELIFNIPFPKKMDEAALRSIFAENQIRCFFRAAGADPPGFPAQ